MIDAFTIREYFIRPLDLIKFSSIRFSDVDILFKKLASDNTETDTSKNRYLNRAKFFVLVIKLAHLFYVEERDRATKSVLGKFMKTNILSALNTLIN